MEDTKGKTIPVKDKSEDLQENDKKKPAKVEQLTPSKVREINEVMRDGRGRLGLKSPFTVGDTEVTELVYDFNELTGLEYAEAMDSDSKAFTAFSLTYRQGLALFARAAAKQTDGIDMRDILEHISSEDAVEAIQLGTLFFTVSTREGQRRISKK